MPLKSLKQNSYYSKTALKVVDSIFRANVREKNPINQDNNDKLELARQFEQAIKVLDQVGVGYDEADLYSLVEYDQDTKKIKLSRLITRIDKITSKEEPITVPDLLPVQPRTLQELQYQNEDTEFNAVKAFVNYIKSATNTELKEDKACISRIERGSKVRKEEMKIMGCWLTLAEECGHCEIEGGYIKMSTGRLNVIEELALLKKDVKRSKEQEKNPSVYLQFTADYIKQLYEYEQRLVAGVELF